MKLALRVGLAGLLSVAAVAAADPLQPVTRPTAAQELDLVAVEAIVRGLKQVIWDLHADDAAFRPDAAGRRPGNDADEWLLPPDVIGQIDLLRAKWLEQESANDRDALERTKSELNQLLDIQKMRMIVLGEYWYVLMDFVQKHEDLLLPLMEQLPAAEGIASRGRLEPLLKRLPDSIRPMLASINSRDYRSRVLVAEDTWADAMLALNEERGRLAALVSMQRSATGESPVRRVRQSACPPASARGSGTDTPAVDEFKRVQPTYPKDFRQRGYKATVVLDLGISATGCMLFAEVFQSSGIPALDDAALDWAESTAFLPGESNGAKADGTLRLEVPFLELLELNL